MDPNATRTRRQMIGSALGVLGAGALVMSKLSPVDALSSVLDPGSAHLDEPATALEQAERLRLQGGTIGFPVELSTEIVLIDNFGGNSVGNGPGGHQGVDIWRKDGQPGHPLLACRDGVLIMQEFDHDKMGNAWILQDIDGTCYRYHHIEEFQPGLEVGDRVDIGDVVGTMGATGNPSDSAPHLHFEVRQDTHHGTPVDPFPLFGLPLPNVTVY